MQPRTLTELRRLVAHTVRSQRLRRGMSTRELGRLAGISRAQICQYERGANVPSLPVAALLADALGSTAIVDLAREAWTRQCRRCGQPFARTAGRPGLYCSASCSRLYLLAHPRERLHRMTEQLQEDVRAYRAAISGMCAACPDGEDGLCRAADCALRPVSPLPLLQIVEKKVR